MIAEANRHGDGLDAQAFHISNNLIRFHNSDTEAQITPEVSPFSQLEAAEAEWLRPSESITHPKHLDLINTELWLDELSKNHGRPITLSTIPEREWDNLADVADGVWVMGVFTQSEASRRVSLEWSWQQKEAYPDLDPEKDMRGCPFAIKDHAPDPKIANGWEEFDVMVEQAHSKGLRVFADFIPNHVAEDHAWVTEHPDWFIQGTEEDYNNAQDDYFEITDSNGERRLIARGKDPNFYPWIDTAQLNYANPQLQEAMKGILLNLVNHGIDGVRCDMAHLVLPETFIATWGHTLSDEEQAYLMERDPETGRYVNDFWKKVIPEIKQQTKERASVQAMSEGKTDEEVTDIVEQADFYFIAEAYSDDHKRQLDSTTGESSDGFDYIYGKDFYDNLLRLKNGELSSNDLRNHLIWIMEGRKRGEKHYQEVLFVENHDEERAMQTFGLAPSQAAALLELFTPDTLFLLNQGQDIGRWIKPAMQMKRFPGYEVPNLDLKEFYDRNLSLQRARIFQEGNARLVGLAQDNPNIFSFRYESPTEQTESGEQQSKLIAMPLINYGDHYASCLIPEVDRDMDVKVVDLISGDEVENIDVNREGGFYVGLEPWGAQMVYFTPKVA